MSNQISKLESQIYDLRMALIKKNSQNIISASRIISHLINEMSEMKVDFEKREKITNEMFQFLQDELVTPTEIKK